MGGADARGQESSTICCSRSVRPWRSSGAGSRSSSKRSSSKGTFRPPFVSLRSATRCEPSIPISRIRPPSSQSKRTASVVTAPGMPSIGIGNGTGSFALLAGTLSDSLGRTPSVPLRWFEWSAGGCSKAQRLTISAAVGQAVARLEVDVSKSLSVGRAGMSKRWRPRVGATRRER